ncbi:MAG: VOC family protein [Pseudomonadota bacterium]
MAKVTGIGGLFFRATDPEALQSWYAEHLGLPAGPMPWMQEAGPTVFAPFERGSDYFPDQFLHMINLRVDDLTGLIAQLEAAGIAVETREEWDGPHGRFARIHDPEGNPIELWQPPAALPAAPEGDASA